jgi:glutathione-regulated potassium-efflux system protein KefB
MIDAAREYGFKVYYGDGTRLDILHAADAGAARCWCAWTSPKTARGSSSS